MIANTNDVSIDQCNVDPLSPPAPTSQLPGASMTTSDFTIEEEGIEGDDDEFTAAHSRSLFHSFLRYTRAIFALLSVCVLDLTSANNTSFVSKIVRIFVTVSIYGTVFTSSTGLLMWAIAYLMDHGWYLLAVTCSVVLLLLCVVLLVFYEWMWQWQGRIISVLCGGSDINSHRGYNILRSVNILDDDDMEDGLTLRGWIKQIIEALVSCFIWVLYCMLNVKVDFWITDQYIVARPAYHTIELRLVNCFEAAPVLLGAALLLYYAYPSFYRLSFHHERVSTSATISGNVDTIDVPFASTEDENNTRYTIGVDEDNEVTIGAGMQNLII